MKKRLFRFVLITAIILAVVSCQTVVPRPDRDAPLSMGDAIAYLQKYIEAEMKKDKVTGIGVALADKDGIIWSQGFGYADNSTKRELEADDIFLYASVSKLFTCTAVMQLAEQGLIDIDAPISDYIPEFSVKSRFEDTQPITARLIMSHYSGLPTGDGYRGAIDMYPKQDFNVVLENIKNEYLLFMPGYLNSYSNSGITLLGVLIERVSGKSFDEYMEEEIFRPLGMSSASFIPIGIRIKNDDPLKYAMGHDDSRSESVIDPPDALRPCGSISSSVNDMASFIRMVLHNGEAGGDQIIEQDTLEEMLTPQYADNPFNFGNYQGLGYFLTNSRLAYAGKFCGHGGDLFSYHADLSILPEQGIGIITVTNSASGSLTVRRISSEVLKIYLQSEKGILPPPQEEENTVELSREEIEALSGDYATGAGYIHVKDEKNKLTCEVFGYKFDLIPLGDDKFRLQYNLLGFIPVKISMLDSFRIRLKHVDDKTVILLDEEIGNEFVAGAKVTPVEIPESWKDICGKYKVTNIYSETPQAMPEFEDLEIYIDNDYLFLGEGLPDDYIIFPVSSNEAVIAGLGRATGETVYSYKENGKQMIRYMGWIYEKEK